MAGSGRKRATPRDDAKRIDESSEPRPSGSPRGLALAALRRFIEPLTKADERFRAAGLDPDDAECPPDAPAAWFAELAEVLDRTAESLDGIGDAHGAALLRILKRDADDHSELPSERGKLMYLLVGELNHFLDGREDEPGESNEEQPSPGVRMRPIVPAVHRSPPLDDESFAPVRPPDQAAVAEIAELASLMLRCGWKVKNTVGKAADHAAEGWAEHCEALHWALWFIGCGPLMDDRKRTRLCDALVGDLPVPAGMRAYLQRIEQSGFDPADRSAEAEYYRRTKQAETIFRLRSAYDAMGGNDVTGGDDPARAMGAFQLAAVELAKLVQRPAEGVTVEEPPERQSADGTGTERNSALAGEPTIVSLGNRNYRLGDGPERHVTNNEDCVLTAFLKLPAMDEAELKRRSGVPRGREVLRDLRKKYDGDFADAIHLPGKKGAGGYRVRIRAE